MVIDGGFCFLSLHSLGTVVSLFLVIPHQISKWGEETSLLLLLFLLFNTGFFLCSIDCPGIYYVDQSGLQLTEITKCWDQRHVPPQPCCRIAMYECRRMREIAFYGADTCNNC